MNYCCISDYLKTYRQVLMGLGMVSVLLVHLYHMAYLPTLINIFLKDATSFIYVEGFLFLSGFGLYFSYSSNCLTHFYKRRIKRLFIPYIILMLPYIIITSIHDNDSYNLILARVIGISFWIEGNYASMWYVHVLLLCYLIYPFFHKFLIKGSFPILGKLIVLCAIYGCILISFSSFFPVFFSRSSFALYKIFFFFFGAFVANSSKNYKDNKENESSIWLSIWIVAYIAISISNYSNSMELRNTFYSAYFIPLSVLSVAFLDAQPSNAAKWLLSSLRWFGKYTLEIYILHMMIMYVMLRWGFNIRISIFTGEMLSLAVCAPVHSVLGKLINFKK